MSGEDYDQRHPHRPQVSRTTSHHTAYTSKQAQSQTALKLFTVERTETPGCSKVLPNVSRHHRKRPIVPSAASSWQANCWHITTQPCSVITPPTSSGSYLSSMKSSHRGTKADQTQLACVSFVAKGTMSEDLYGPFVEEQFNRTCVENTFAFIYSSSLSVISVHSCVCVVWCSWSIPVSNNKRSHIQSNHHTEASSPLRWLNV